MRRLLLVLFAAGCGEPQQGPFTALPLDTQLDVAGLDGRVHVARDRFGIAHVYAKTVRDLGFAQGYVTAHDRLPQLDMLRRFADGTLAEIYGGFDDDVVATDLEMRFHLAEPTRLAMDATSLQPALCDDQTTVPVESCSRLVLAAMLDAVAQLELDLGAPETWHWGRAHRVQFRPPFFDPEHVFFLPATDGFPLAGDTVVVDRADAGWGDLDFTPTVGVAYRMLAIGSAFDEPLRLRLELQSGTVLDRRDPHYRDLLETSYLTGEGFDVPLSLADINQNGESRWEFR